MKAGKDDLQQMKLSEGLGCMEHGAVCLQRVPARNTTRWPPSHTLLLLVGLVGILAAVGQPLWEGCEDVKVYG